MQKSGPGDFGRTEVSIRLATTIEVERQVFIEPITDAADNEERNPIFGARMGDGRRFHVNAGDSFIAQCPGQRLFRTRLADEITDGGRDSEANHEPAAPYLLSRSKEFFRRLRDAVPTNLP